MPLYTLKGDDITIRMQFDSYEEAAKVANDNQMRLIGVMPHGVKMEVRSTQLDCAFAAGAREYLADNDHRPTIPEACDAARRHLGDSAPMRWVARIAHQIMRSMAHLPSKG